MEMGKEVTLLALIVLMTIVPAVASAFMGSWRGSFFIVGCGVAVWAVIRFLLMRC
jgi:hypothetical protein